jgi:hypothetical protein
MNNNINTQNTKDKYGLSKAPVKLSSQELESVGGGTFKARFKEFTITKKTTQN